MTNTTEFTSIAKVRKAVNEILKNATDFGRLLDEIRELEDRSGHFIVMLMSGDDIGEGYDDERWYIWIENIRTEKEIIFDVNDIINSLD